MTTDYFQKKQPPYHLTGLSDQDWPDPTVDPETSPDDGEPGGSGDEGGGTSAEEPVP